jgi:hypothetical protein
MSGIGGRCVAGSRITPPHQSTEIECSRSLKPASARSIESVVFFMAGGQCGADDKATVFLPCRERIGTETPEFVKGDQERLPEWVVELSSFVTDLQVGGLVGTVKSEIWVTKRMGLTKPPKFGGICGVAAPDSWQNISAPHEQDIQSRRTLFAARMPRNRFLGLHSIG